MLALALVVLLLLSGCEFYFGPKVTPDSNPDDFWFSTEPEIWFVGFDEEKGGAAGQLVTDCETVEIEMAWGPGTRFYIFRYPGNEVDDLLVRGKCKFSQDEGVVQIVEDVGDIFDGVKELHFVRVQKEGDGRHGDC